MENSESESTDLSPVPITLARREMSKVHSYLYRQVLAIRTGLGDGHVYTLEETARIFHITEADVADIEMEAIEQVDPVLIARAQNCGVQKDEE